MRAKGDQIETWWDIAHYRGEIRRSRTTRSLRIGLGMLLVVGMAGYAACRFAGLI